MARLRLLASGCLASLAAACSMTPAYRPPTTPMPVAFKEAGGWVRVDPAAAPVSPLWWAAYHDPVLDGLETQIATANPTLAQYLARYDAARAAVRGARADLLPAIGLSSTLLSNRQSDNRPLRSASQPAFYGADTLAGSINLDFDLWGRVRSNVAAARADSQASADDVAAVKLSLEEQLATLYAELRGYDRQRELLAATVKTYADADTLVRRRFAGGIASGIDTSRSGAQLDEARAALDDVDASRALAEHAIAGLVGAPASTFAITPSTAALPVPALPALLPSTLLADRPDVAAAERRMAAANERIGAARAAFFPSIGLGAQGGFQNTAIAGLVAAPNLFWAVGPTNALTLFDGGRRRAQLAQARAQWDGAVAAYRGQVLVAFRDVEDDLARLHHLGDEQRDEDMAAREAGDAEALSLNRYVKGAVTLLDVTTAQTTSLRIKLTAIAIETRRVEASMRLSGSLGGGSIKPGRGAMRTPGDQVARHYPPPPR